MRLSTPSSKGVYITPMYVTRIEDKDGNVLTEFTNTKREAIGERTAYLMVNLMSGVINHGTGYRLRGTYGLTGEIAGKTGTTNDNSDGWFIGYTPPLPPEFGWEARTGRFISTASRSEAAQIWPCRFGGFG